MKIIYKDGHVDECPQDQELHVIRHTAAHVMAQAIKRLYPEADFAFGPATENGFYYDVDLGDTKLTDEDLANIEKEMHKITKENLAIKPFILPRAEAVKLMEERHENYKVEHMADLADETEFSFFQQGEYVDMCIGPHLTYTKAPPFRFARYATEVFGIRPGSMNETELARRGIAATESFFPSTPFSHQSRHHCCSHLLHLPAAFL